MSKAEKQFLVKRTKGGKDLPERVHYATAVGRDGSVTGWTDKEEKAKAVDRELADKVAEAYAARPNAGTVECCPCDRDHEHKKAEAEKAEADKKAEAVPPAPARGTTLPPGEKHEQPAEPKKAEPSPKHRGS